MSPTIDLMMWKDVAHVNNVEYLSGNISENGRVEVEVRRRIQAGANARRNVDGVMMDINISRKLKGNVLDSCVVPTSIHMALVRKAPVTPGLRPGYDLPATEKWANRRKNVRLVAEVVRLVAEVVGDRKGQIGRNKVVVMFKTRSHRAYDQVTTYLRWKKFVMMGQS